MMTFTCRLLPLILFAVIMARAQWTRTQGPDGAFATFLFAHGNTAFVSTTAGLYRSADEGATWSRSDSGLSASSMVAAASDGQIVYAANTIFVFTSSDNGLTWTRAHTDAIISIKALAVIGGNLIAGTTNGFQKSVNKGAGWTPANTGFPGKQVFSLQTEGSTVYAGTDSGLFVSGDQGATWARPGNPVREPFYSIQVEGLDVWGGALGGVHYSQDGGKTWTFGRVPTSNLQVKSLFPVGTDLLAGTSSTIDSGYGIFRSSDKGSNWTPSTSGMPFTEGGPFAKVGDHILACASTAGVYRSSDGGKTWTPSNRGMKATVNALVPRGNVLYALTYSDVFSTTDKGSAWTPSKSGLDKSGFNDLIHNGTYFFAGNGSGRVYRSVDGLDWTRTTKPLEATLDALHAVGTTVHAGTYKTKDQGLVWTLRDNQSRGGTIKDYAALGNRVFDCGSTGRAVVMTHDDGATVVNKTQGLLTGSYYAIEVLDKDLFVAGDSGVFRSVDSAETWTRTATPAGFRRIAKLLADGEILYAGGSNGSVWRSADRGATWIEASQGLGTSGIRAMAVLGPDLYVGTLNTGVWRRPLAELASGIRRPGKDGEGSGFSIREWSRAGRGSLVAFVLKSGAEVELSLHDARGRRIAELMKGARTAGTHEARLPGEMAPGVHFLKLAADGRTFSLPILID